MLAKWSLRLQQWPGVEQLEGSLVLEEQVGAVSRE